MDRPDRHQLLKIDGKPTDAGLPFPTRRSELALFKGLVRSLARDALAGLQELSARGEMTSEQLRQLGLVHHYLSYLVRLCDGRV